MEIKGKRCEIGLVTDVRSYRDGRTCFSGIVRCPAALKALKVLQVLQLLRQQDRPAVKNRLKIGQR